jgi:uncharacterized protein YbjT (DUF2867 family)
MVSSMGADAGREGDDTYSAYQRAKGKADAEVAASGLDHTIVRPGRLTDDPGTGRVRAGEQVGRAEIPRDDVAAVLAACLVTPSTIGLTFEVVGGDTPIAEAIEALGIRDA